MKRNVRTLLPKLRVPALFGAFFLLSVLLIAQRVQMIKIGDRLSCLQNELRTVESVNGELEYEIGRLLDTDKLAQIAFEDFGLRSANFDEIVVMNEPKMEVELPGTGPWEKVRIVLANSIETIIAGISGGENMEISGSI